MKKRKLVPVPEDFKYPKKVEDLRRDIDGDIAYKFKGSKDIYSIMCFKKLSDEGTKLSYYALPMIGIVRGMGAVNAFLYAIGGVKTYV